MAITAAITLGSATCKALQKIAVTCTVTNGNASTVNVTSVQPQITLSGVVENPGAYSVGQPNLGPGMTTSVAASGTLGVNFDITPMTPQCPTYGTNPFPSAGVGGVAITPLQPNSQPHSQIYTIGAIVTTSDGSVTSATTTTLTVSPVDV
jgi:hypothetical protein